MSELIEGFQSLDNDLVLSFPVIRALKRPEGRAPSECSVRSEIFVATRATPFPSPSGRHIPLLTELETLFDFGCCNYAASDGAENESQRGHW